VKKQLIDQGAHFGVAFGLLLTLVLAPGFLSFTLVGGALGLIREVTEEGPVTSRGSLLDIIFWTLGGLMAGIVYEILN